MVNGSTRFVGILGKPLEHSFSPFIHNRAFALLDMNWIYLPFLLKHANEMKTALEGLKMVGCRGLNVTAPYKETVIPLLDEVSDTVLTLGAVNTIVFVAEDGNIRLRGENTDIQGFSNAIKEDGFDLTEARLPIVVGAGGAARAVIGALIQSSCPSMVLMNRSAERAEVLRKHFEKYDIDIRYAGDNLAMQAQRSNLLINTTPLGTFPNVNGSIWADNQDIPTHLVVYDLVYNPQETKLLQQAKRSGARAMGGLGMLVHQAALSFEFWTGEKMAYKEIRNELEQKNVERQRREDKLR